MWRVAAPAQAGELAAYVARWQAALWRFTTVGHIGKRDGPTAWQVPVSPLAETREVRLPLPAPDAAGVVRVYLQTSDAGDGAEQDAAVWKNPRLVAPGRPDIRLRDLRATMAAVAVRRKQLAETAAECLAAAAEVTKRCW